MNKGWIISGLVVLSVLFSACGKAPKLEERMLTGLCMEIESKNLSLPLPETAAQRCLNDAIFIKIPDKGRSGNMCWDLNRNGVSEPREDVNEDGRHDTKDCEIPGRRGVTGRYIWSARLADPQPGSGEPPTVDLEVWPADQINFRVIFGIPRGAQGPPGIANTTCLSGSEGLIHTAASSESYCRSRCPNEVAAHIRADHNKVCVANADDRSCSANSGSYVNFCCVCKP